jgi:hypothetical protein
MAVDAKAVSFVPVVLQGAPSSLRSDEATDRLNGGAVSEAIFIDATRHGALPCWRPGPGLTRLVKMQLKSRDDRS